MIIHNSSKHFKYTARKLCGFFWLHKKPLHVCFLVSLAKTSLLIFSCYPDSILIRFYLTNSINQHWKICPPKSNRSKITFSNKIFTYLIFVLNVFTICTLTSASSKAAHISFSMAFSTSSLMTVALLSDFKALVIFLPRSANTILIYDSLTS